MSVAWALEMFALYVTTVGALLLFLYLWRSPRLAEAWSTAEGRLEYQKHRRRLVIGVGLLAVWLVVEDLALIFL